MSVLDKAKAHYQNKLSEEPREIKIPEWDTTAYIKPAMSLQRLGEVMEAANSGKSAEAMVLTIIYRLIDEDGKPIGAQGWVDEHQFNWPFKVFWVKLSYPIFTFFDITKFTCSIECINYFFFS